MEPFNQSIWDICEARRLDYELYGDTLLFFFLNQVPLLLQLFRRTLLHQTFNQRVGEEMMTELSVFGDLVLLSESHDIVFKVEILSTKSHFILWDHFQESAV